MTNTWISKCQLVALIACTAVAAVYSSSDWLGEDGHIHSLVVNSLIMLLITAFFWFPLVVISNVRRRNPMVSYVLLPFLAYFTAFFILAAWSPATEVRIGEIEVISDGVVTAAGYKVIAMSSVEFACIGGAFGVVFLTVTALCGMAVARLRTRA